MTEVVKNENIVCTVINITQRNLNILYRYFNIYGSKCYKKLQEYEGDRHIWENADSQVYTKMSSKDFPFVCEFEVTLQDNDINNFVLTCNLYLNNIRIHTFKILNNSEEFNVNEHRHNLECLQKEYRLCKCGHLCSDGRDQCNKCYVYDYEHEENCSICLENNYVWEKLECGHCFHDHCLNKLTKYRCPLCRQEFCPSKRGVRM